MSPTPTLYNLVKLCKSFWYIECKRNINGTAKREEVVDVFREGKFELLALMEMNGNGEVLCVQ